MLLAALTSWDTTSIAIALPVITSQLEEETIFSLWLSLAVIFGSVAFLPDFYLQSKIGLLSPKSLLYVSVLMYAIGSLTFATAGISTILTVGRLLQGIGTSGLDVFRGVLLETIISPEERPCYYHLIVLSQAVGTIAGPFMGAAFSEFLTWRMIGWVNLLFVGGALGLSFLADLPPIQITLGGPDIRSDWLGLLFYDSGLFLLAVSLSIAGQVVPWSSWQVLVSMAIGLALIFVFGIYEKWPAEPMMPYRIFSKGTTAAALITGFAHGFVLYTLLVYQPLFFQAVFLQTPLQAAISTLPLCCLFAVFSFLTPIIMGAIPRIGQILITVNWALIVVAGALWCTANQDTPWAEIYTLQAALGLSLGVIFGGTQFSIRASVSHARDIGLAVSMLAVFELLGALFGLSLSSGLFGYIFEYGITLLRSLGPLPGDIEPLVGVRQAMGFIPTLRTLELPNETMSKLIGVYSDAFLLVWLFGELFAFVGLAVSWFVMIASEIKRH